MRTLPLICLMLVAMATIAAALTVPSHYVTKYYSVREVRNRRRCWSCGWWWGRRRCCSTDSYYVSVRRSYRACEAGYMGTQCNIPICSPTCTNRGVCVAVNKCDCPSSYTGYRCQTAKCSWKTDCYPGICDRSSVRCTCSSEFDGSNCDKMKEGPIFQTCSASLIDGRDGRNDVFNVTCSFHGDEVKIYSNMRDFTQVGLEWTPTYRKLQDLPPFPAEGFVRTFRVGLVSASAEVVLKDTDGGVALQLPVTCPSNGSWQTPQETIRCRQVIRFNESVKHNQTLTFIMSGTTGGFKDIRNQDTAGSYKSIQIHGREGSIKAYVLFDLEPPFHCTENENVHPCEDDDDKAIMFNQQITTNSNISITFLGWHDLDSGVRGFTYEVYRLANFGAVLQNHSTPVLSKEYDMFQEGFGSKFQLPEPGMYSVVAGVHDFANNTRYTRGFILYSSPNDTIQTTDIPLSVTPGPGTQNVSNAFWISDLSSPVTLKWGNHYANRFLSQNKYGNPVASLPNEFFEVDGDVSSKGIQNIDGITKFSYAVVQKLQFPKSRSRRQIVPPENWIDLNPLKDRVTLGELTPRVTGNSYTIHMKVEDMLGNVLTDYVYIRVDNTPPTTEDIPPNFLKKVTGVKNGFFSSVDVSSIENDGALHSIGYTLYDIYNPKDPKEIFAGIQLINQTTKDKKLCQLQGSCVCNRENECYDKPLKLYLDNCLFVEYMNVPVKVNISVNNAARLSTNVTYELGKVSGISGIGEYPSPLGLRVKNAYGYVVVLTWYLPVSCYEIRSMNLKLTGASEKSAILSANEEEVEVKDLVPYADYTASLSITYQGNRESESITLRFNTGKPPTPVGSKCGTGCIAGIVIGLLILFGVIGVVVLVVIRLRQHRTPLPGPFMPPVNRISRRFGHTGWGDEEIREAPPSYRDTIQEKTMALNSNEINMTLNVVYSSDRKLGDFEEDIYTYGEMKTDAKAKWKHSDDRVLVGKTLSKGRFAEIKEGTLRDKTGTRKVAVKILLDRSADNILLMKAKMNFLATVVPKHNNLVNFIGAVPEGPIILLELCDFSLREWLKKVEKVTDDDEDNMINFCTDVARGMSFLHENGILHRRLGARNVLLKRIPEMLRIVAKITGFGPMTAEASGTVESDKERIPIKWMALEQLGIEAGEKRPYTNATDVWSFGVTIWEIFSTGATPFANIRSFEVREFLVKGSRLEQPRYASDELYTHIMMPCWNSSPESRPTFQQITNDLVSLFNAEGGGDMYYDDAPKGNDMQIYDGTLPE